MPKPGVLQKPNQNLNESIRARRTRSSPAAASTLAQQKGCKRSGGAFCWARVLCLTNPAHQTLRVTTNNLRAGSRAEYSGCAIELQRKCLPKPGVLQKPNQNLNKSMRARPTIKLTRRRKRSDEVRNERRSEAVGGRVQCLVVLRLVSFNFHLFRQRCVWLHSIVVLLSFLR